MAEVNRGGAPLGNKNGVNFRWFQNELRKCLKHDEATLAENQRRLRRAADRLLTDAANGEEWAIKELANRLDGKAVQGVAMVNPDGSAQNLFSPAMIRGLAPEEMEMLQKLLAKAGAAISDESTE